MTVPTHHLWPCQETCLISQMGCIWPKNHQHFYVFLLHVNIYRNTVYCGLFLQSQTFKLEKELQKNCLVTNSELNGQEIIYSFVWTSLMAQTVKRLPTMWETRVWSLGRTDPLEKEMATHSSTLAWKIPWEDPGRLQSMGSQRVGHDWATSLSLSLPFAPPEKSSLTPLCNKTLLCVYYVQM